MPVPWVTRWSEEVSDVAYGISVDEDGQFLRYPVETPFDRDQRGILWLRENPLSNGEGTPDFKTFSSYRQRTCMEDGVCQVCGSTIEPPYYWLMTAPQWLLFKRFKNVTENPPLCERCVAETEHWCPHVKTNPYTVIEATRFTIVGYMGEIAMQLETGQLYRRMLPILFDTDPKILRSLLARQLSVHIDEGDYRVISEVSSRTSKSHR